ncbi:MAG: hypothetical protein IIB57_10960, partial [Planctomycetes bacterium]|nr:hypothetical protein [Planctomycetota bacterium]
MDRRTKILAGLFAVVVGYGIFSSVVYPTWIEPLVTIDDRIAARQRDLDKLLDKEREVDQAKREYVAMIERIGSVDPGKVENDLRERLNVLIAKHDLTGASVTPGRPSFDRKTGVAKMTISVSASGTLESAILFLRDVTELPHLIRVGTVALSPVRSSRKIRQADRVNLRVPITAKVLPQKKILGKKIEQDELSQPDRLVRHLGRDYSPIWAGTPFTRYIKLDPLVVTVKRGDIKVNVNQRGVRFEVSAKGGDGRYSYAWSPTEGLTGDRSPRPKVDTKEPGERSYILTVSDSSGNEVQVVVTIDVQEKPKRTPKS